MSLRLATRDIERLQARAHVVSGTLAGIARDLIATGLSGGDNRAMSDRLLAIERKLIALEGTAREQGEQAECMLVAVSTLATKFDALLNALSSSDGATP